MIQFALIFVYVLFFFTESKYVAGIDVTLPNGIIRGRNAITPDNTTYYSFQDIPYGKPPVGDLRFQAPVPFGKWDGFVDCTANRKVCYQGGHNNLQDEDCLYLNVYTPVEPSSNANLPVLFWIHGGGFQEGSGRYALNGPDFLLEHNMIVVTINYRLGPLGFLSTGDEVIPGNAGLKDQVLALKWVQANIEFFGGDPSRVTIDGQSAGSASVGYLTLSKSARGLFWAGIAESGTPLNEYAFEPHPKAMAYELASRISPTFSKNQSSEDLRQFLTNCSAADIAFTSLGDIPQGIGRGYYFVPVLEPDNEGAFLTDHAHSILRNGDFADVPLLIGFNSEETIGMANDLKGLRSTMASFDDNLRLIVKNGLHVAEKNLLATGKELRSIYVPHRFQDDLASSIRFYSDMRYTTSITEHAVLHSKQSPCYFYQFSYQGDMGNNFAEIEGAGKVAHSENLPYIWKSDRTADLSKFSDTDVLVHNRFLKIYENFVHYRNPTPEKDPLLENITWPQCVTQGIFKFVDLDEAISIQTKPRKYAEWKLIIDKYGTPPFDTY